LEYRPESAIYAVVSGIVWIAGAIWIVRNGNDTKPLGVRGESDLLRSLALPQGRRSLHSG